MSIVSNPMDVIYPKNNINNFSSSTFGMFNDAGNQFANILEREMNNNINGAINSPFESLGVPAGFQIQEFNPADYVQKVSENGKLDNGGGYNLLDFAKKHAADYYNKHSGSVVMDLAEFVSDALKK